MITFEEIKKSTEKSFTHSSGAGGQNVNKTSTKVHLVFDIQVSSLNDVEKKRLIGKFPNAFIHVMNQETRSQSQNTHLAFEQLKSIIEDSLRLPKLRKKVVAPYLTTGGKRVKAKKAHLQKYRNRYLEG